MTNFAPSLSFSLAEYQKARADIKQYYESSMSERIALYTQSRERAITRASEIGECLRDSTWFRYLSDHLVYLFPHAQTIPLTYPPYWARTCSSTRCRPRPLCTMIMSGSCATHNASTPTRRTPHSQRPTHPRQPRRAAGPVPQTSRCRSTSPAASRNRSSSSWRTSVCIHRTMLAWHRACIITINTQILFVSPLLSNRKLYLFL